MPTHLAPARRYDSAGSATSTTLTRDEGARDDPALCRMGCVRSGPTEDEIYIVQRSQERSIEDAGFCVEVQVRRADSERQVVAFEHTIHSDNLPAPTND